jgi:hypothetical protein
MRYSRDMGAGPFDARAFDTAEALDDAVGGTEPVTLDRAIDETRQAIRDGKIKEDEAVESLMNRFGGKASGQAAKLLSTAIRRCLTSNRPLAPIFAELQQGQAELPDEREVDAMRMRRDEAAIRYRRETGTAQPEALRYSRDEVNRAAVISSKSKGKLSFDDAIRLIRTGR